MFDVCQGINIRLTEDRTKYGWRPLLASCALMYTGWLKDSIKRGIMLSDVDLMDHLIAAGVKPSQIILLASNGGGAHYQ